MENIELYKAVFSQVHSGITIQIEDYKKMKKSYKTVKRTVILAAAVCLMTACTVTAYAANLLGLKDMVTRREAPADFDWYFEEDGSDADVETVVRYEFSFQGYADSNESKAIAEWNEFFEGYVFNKENEEKLNDAGNKPADYYFYYGAYNQEMADKLDEIAAKYDLKLYTQRQVLLSGEELFEMAGTGNFLGTIGFYGEINEVYGLSGVYYEDGSFSYYGYAVLQNGKALNYSFSSYKKGSLAGTGIINMGDLDDYEEWAYETSGGITVNIAAAPYKFLITPDFNDSSDSFVCIYAGINDNEYVNVITPADIELFADSFDFSMLS